MNVSIPRVRWVRSTLLAGAAMSVGAAYLLVPPAGAFAGLAVVNWFWVALLTVPCVLYFAAKRQRARGAVAACVCSLAIAVYAFGSARMVREDREIEALQRVTRPIESPETAVGGAAPEIEAADLAGARMRLSEHRGKVVLLVFWASWCGPCMRDVAHEKELVEHFQGRPFVIVGVNGDRTQDKAASAARAALAIPWRSFWNGGDDGPIARQWGIQAWPSLFVIDDEGVIRHNYLRGRDLDGPLEELVRAAEARAPVPRVERTNDHAAPRLRSKARCDGRRASTPPRAGVPFHPAGRAHAGDGLGGRGRPFGRHARRGYRAARP